MDRVAQRLPSGVRRFGCGGRRAVLGRHRCDRMLAALSAFCVAALFLSLAYSGILVVVVGLTALATGAARADLARVWPAGTVVDRASFSRPPV